MSYTGRQDFGDGEGNLLDHVKHLQIIISIQKKGSSL